MHARNPRGATSATSTSTSATPCALFTAPLACIQTQLRKWIKNIETLESLAKLEARQHEIRRDFMAKAPPNNIADARAQTGLDNPMHAGDHPNLMGSTAPLLLCNRQPRKGEP